MELRMKHATSKTVLSNAVELRGSYNSIDFIENTILQQGRLWAVDLVAVVSVVV